MMLARLRAERRAALMGGAGLAVLLVVFALPRLLGGGEDPFANLGDTGTATAAGVVTGAGGTGTAAAPATPAAPVTPAAPATPVGGGHHADGYETAMLRDPFCPLVASVASGTAGVNCPEQAPAATGAPFSLLDVFLDVGVPHARVRVGPNVYTLHVDDAFDAYRVVSLAGTCGEFARGEERQSLCEGGTWGTPAP